MSTRPECWSERHASVFQEPSVADAYQYRPPYARAVVPLLLQLTPAPPQRVLDVGCGTGALARFLVPHVAVDAVDVSAAMVERGRRLPRGDDQHLRWMVGRVEDAAFDPPYDLIVAGDSLHWMKWDIVMPRFAELLAPGGVLAIVENGQSPPSWDAQLGALIRAFSTNRNYRPVDVVEELTARGLFEPLGALDTLPEPFRQSLDDYVESFHGRASFSREHMRSADATAFDARLRALVRSYVAGDVELAITARLVWGRPLVGDSGVLTDRS